VEFLHALFPFQYFSPYRIMWRENLHFDALFTYERSSAVRMNGLAFLETATYRGSFISSTVLTESEVSASLILQPVVMHDLESYAATPIFTTHLPKIHLYVLLPSASLSSKWTFS